MRYELTDRESAAHQLPNKPRGVPRINDRRVLNGIFWVNPCHPARRALFERGFRGRNNPVSCKSPDR